MHNCKWNKTAELQNTYFLHLVLNFYVHYVHSLLFLIPFSPISGTKPDGIVLCFSTHHYYSGHNQRLPALIHMCMSTLLFLEKNWNKLRVSQAQRTKLSQQLNYVLLVAEFSLSKSSCLVNFISIQDLFGHISIIISGCIT